MKRTLHIACAFALVSSLAACAGQGTTAAAPTATNEADLVVAQVKRQQTDFRAFCQTGTANVTRVVGEAVGQLVRAGTIKGDPAAVGSAAGTKIATDCRA